MFGGCCLVILRLRRKYLSVTAQRLPFKVSNEVDFKLGFSWITNGFVFLWFNPVQFILIISKLILNYHKIKYQYPIYTKIISVKLKKIITKFWIKENVRTLFSYNLTLNGLYATKFSGHCWWWFNDNIQTKIPQIIWSVWIGTQSICLYFNFLYAFSLIYSKKPKREFQLHIQHPSTCCLGRSKYLQKYYANN